MGTLRWCRVPGLGVLVVSLACGGDGGGGNEPPGPPAQVVKSGGDNQDWYFDNPLPTPYGVTVRDANGRAVPGVVVAWQVTAGGGSLSAPQSTTAASGVATTVHTLGPSGAVQTVTATVANLPAVTFTANAAAPPTTAAVLVENNSFSPQSVVIGSGGTVTWTWNSGGVQHNVTYTSGPTPRPTNSGTKGTGDHSNTITIVGQYGYACTLHAGMTGSVTVVN
jgi:plastocyanin